MMTDPTPVCVPPTGGQLPAPAWASSSELFVDFDRSVQVLHSWSAPQVGTLVFGSDEVLPCVVELHRDDRIVSAAGANPVLEAGQPFVFLSSADARFASVDDARSFAAAILACCDRLDTAEA